MNTRLILACLVVASLAESNLLLAAEPGAESSSATQFVEDSAIEAAVKSNIAANHLANLMQLTVDADRDGVVWLGGTTRTQEAADRAVEIARTTNGVNEVKSTIEVSRAAK
jgi:hyperosmotically inducible periplasmic protein